MKKSSQGHSKKKKKKDPYGDSEEAIKYIK